jgi:hypothetical protein
VEACRALSEVDTSLSFSIFLDACLLDCWLFSIRVSFLFSCLFIFPDLFCTLVGLSSGLGYRFPLVSWVVWVSWVRFGHGYGWDKRYALSMVMDLDLSLDRGNDDSNGSGDTDGECDIRSVQVWHGTI